MLRLAAKSSSVPPCGRDGLVNLLDDAPLSHRLHQEHILGPRNAFRADGGTLRCHPSCPGTPASPPAFDRRYRPPSNPEQSTLIVSTSQKPAGHIDSTDTTQNLPVSNF